MTSSARASSSSADAPPADDVPAPSASARIPAAAVTDHSKHRRHRQIHAPRPACRNRRPCRTPQPPSQDLRRLTIHVLEDTELLFLLMLAYFHRSAPDGFRVDSDTRLLHIGMGRDAYESHIWFSRFSLASVIPAPGRNFNGTVDDFGKGGEAIPHLLRLLPGGLDADALGEVSKEVDQQLVRPTPSV